MVFVDFIPGLRSLHGQNSTEFFNLQYVVRTTVCNKISFIQAVVGSGCSIVPGSMECQMLQNYYF